MPKDSVLAGKDIFMERDKFNHGLPEHIWNAAKKEARDAMTEIARREDTISYSELVRRIKSCHLEPQDPRLAHMLGQISTAEDEAGRGLLTVVVVHKTGDMKPGPGFFELAKRRGRDTSDEIRFWSEELKKVHSVWSRTSR